MRTERAAPPSFTNVGTEDTSFRLVMLIGPQHHKRTCKEYAEICDECAKDCARIGEMQECVDACRKCADS